MHREKVVIADANEEFRLSLVQALSETFQVRACSDGAEALELLHQWNPDILITELTLSYFDGIEIIKQISKLPHRPKILVVSGILTDFSGCALEQLGIQYALRKPCSVRTVTERIQEIAALPAPAQKYPSLYAAMASEVLMELGLSNERQGFQHMLVGLPLLMVQRDRRLSKELYAEISAINNSYPSRVEKNIRDAIREAWAHRSCAVWSKYFPDASRCPGNKAFLFRLTDILVDRLLRVAG